MYLSFNNPEPAEIGYKISDTKEEQQKALYEAFEVVRKARRLGLQTRTWAHQTNLETKAFMRRIVSESSEIKSHSVVDKKLWEMACWESKIMAGLKKYMAETSDLMLQLRPLNPPLTTEHLRPFQEAIETDRNTTVEAMGILSQAVQEMTALKTRLEAA